MEEEDFVGCISCASKKDLCDLFAAYSENLSYAQMFEKCFDIKVTDDCKYICSLCAHKLEKATTFKEQTVKHMAVLQGVKDEEYLDESLLEEDFLKNDYNTQKVIVVRKSNLDVFDDNCNDLFDHEAEMRCLEESSCIYCDVHMSSPEEIHNHMRNVHGLEPQIDLKLRKCSVCGTSVRESIADHHTTSCPGLQTSVEGRSYPCHFCDNVYTNRKACFTHLRMKHGLKLSTDQTPKHFPRERKKCPMCNKDFSQKQILNKHMWKAHGFEAEKRKAFICPLCSERVSYGTQFSEHLLAHGIKEQIEKLEFPCMDDFILYKSAIQEETKYRYRKTTASKQTIDGVRSHYMCSQSGVYVYQGKGKRPAPERQIYKTGKACPAHMIVTETLDRVLVTFHMTHVGHGACPYYEPRDVKKCKVETSMVKSEIEPKVESDTVDDCMAWICDSCGKGFYCSDEFRKHVSTHGFKMFPCQYCDNVFQNIEAWTRHLSVEHSTMF